MRPGKSVPHVQQSVRREALPPGNLTAGGSPGSRAPAGSRVGSSGGPGGAPPASLLNTEVGDGGGLASQQRDPGLGGQAGSRPLLASAGASLRQGERIISPAGRREPAAPGGGEGAWTPVWRPSGAGSRPGHPRDSLIRPSRLDARSIEEPVRPQLRAPQHPS